MKKIVIWGIVILVVTITIVNTILQAGWSKWNWGFGSTIIIILALLVLYKWSQLAAATSKELTLIATLAALAALGRVPLAAIPSVQPTTFLVMVSGCVFGPQAGFMVGASAALVSNFFLGQGPWTPWQMLGWGMVGVSSAWLYRIKPGLSGWGLAVFGAGWGFLFGWIQNISFWLTYVYPLNWQTFLATYTASMYFDAVHAATNFGLGLFLGQPVIKILKDYKMRLQVEYESNVREYKEYDREQE